METILLSMIAYIGTNIDDLFFNMIFFAQHHTKEASHSIVTGKYLGIGALTAISLLGARGLQMLPDQWLSLLGLVPIGLGFRDIVSTLRSRHDKENRSASSRFLWMSMMLITIANGADNIGVYLPLFAGFTSRQMITAICIFALMTAVWCFLSKRLTGLPLLQKLLTRYKSILIPLVYILLGFYILFF